MRGIVLIALTACYRETPSPTVSAPAAQPSLSVASKAIIDSLNSGNDAAIAEYLDTGSIRIEWTCPVCSDPQDLGIEERPAVQVVRRAEFIAIVRAAEWRIEQGPHEFRAPVQLTCGDTCCTGPTGSLSPNQLYVTEICFRPGPKLASITYLDAAE